MDIRMPGIPIGQQNIPGADPGQAKDTFAQAVVVPSPDTEEVNRIVPFFPSPICVFMLRAIESISFGPP